MKEGKASRTADAVALARAFESMKPADDRIFYDPLAKGFLSGIYAILAKSQFLANIALWFGERVNPGGVRTAVLRTRYIDDVLKSCIDDGLEQLVILGAGFDARAYRGGGLRGEVKVFEVDHPSTQKLKTHKVKQLFGYLPEFVVYVPIDFDNERLDERLLESGFDRNLRTLFIWEGVTMYLTTEAVDDTLAFMTENAGHGSSVVFDYILKSVVDGTCEEAKKAIKQVSRRGDPFTFGIEDGTIEEFLSQRNFHRVDNRTMESLRDIHSKDKNRNRYVWGFTSIVHAAVKPREASA